MRIGIFHGYELTGSGSNEYCRYLSRTLTELGHEVHVWCREPKPETIAHVTRAYVWDAQAQAREAFDVDAGDAAQDGAGGAPATRGSCTVHVLPHADVRPVFLTDKQRSGVVKSFADLTDEELQRYHDLSTRVMRAGLSRFPVDVLHTNHLVWQPRIASELDTPYVVFPHGSAIEYVVRHDPRCAEAARSGLQAATGIVSGNREVLQRIFDLYPEDRADFESKARIAGVGVDTRLFVPVPRGERAASIELLRAKSPRVGGKTEEQSEELRSRLRRGDFAALGDYRSAYTQAAPDADFVDRLARLDLQRAKLLLFVGSLTAGKGLQDLLAALPGVFAQELSAELVIVGSGAFREVLEGIVHAIDEGDAELWQHIRSRGFDLDASELSGAFENLPVDVPKLPGFATRVHFVGRLDHERLQHVFPCADFAVFPSVVPEAYPLVLMEALANGVLPLVSDFSGFRDGLDELERLLGEELVATMRLPLGAGRVEAIAAKLAERLAGDLDRREELREVAVRNYDWRVRARALVERMTELLEQAKSRPTVRA